MTVVAFINNDGSIDESNTVYYSHLKSAQEALSIWHNLGHSVMIIF